MVLELSAPGVQDTGKAGEVGTDEALVFGEPFDDYCRVSGLLEHWPAGDRLQPTLLRRSGFRRRLRPSVSGHGLLALSFNRRTFECREG